MKELNPLFKEEISHLWEEFVQENKLEYHENIGLSRRPASILSAFRFGGIDGMADHLKSSAIAYLDDNMHGDELYKSLEKLNYHLSNGHLDDVVKLVHNNSLILLALIGTNFPHSLVEQIALFDLLTMHTYNVASNFLNLLFKEYAQHIEEEKRSVVQLKPYEKSILITTIPQGGNQEVRSDMITPGYETVNITVTEALEQECNRLFAQNSYFKYISKCINLFLISLSKYQRYTNISVTDVFTFLYRLSEVAPSIPFVFEEWFPEHNHPPEPDVLLVLDKLQLLSAAKTTISIKNYFPLYDLLKEQIFSEETKLLKCAQEGIINIIKLSNNSSVIAEWVITSDVPKTVMLGLFSHFNECCYDNENFKSEFIEELVLNGSDKIILYGSFGKFSEFLEFVIELVVSCKCLRVKAILLQKFESHIFTSVAERYKFKPKYKIRVFILLSFILLCLFPTMDSFYDFICAQLLPERQSYFMKLFENIFFNKEQPQEIWENFIGEEPYDKVFAQLEIFVFKFCKTLLLVPEYAETIGQRLFFTFIDPWEKQRYLNSELVKPQRAMLIRAGRVFCTVVEAKRWKSLYSMEPIWNKNREFFSRIIELRRFQKFIQSPRLDQTLYFDDKNKPFAKFTMVKFESFYENSFVTNVELLDLIRAIYAQSLEEIINLFNSFYRGVIEGESAKILAYLYDILVLKSLRDKNGPGQTAIDVKSFEDLFTSENPIGVLEHDKKPEERNPDGPKNEHLIRQFFYELLLNSRNKVYLKDRLRTAP